MKPLLLQTKLFPPSLRTKLVDRSRLTDRLTAGRHDKLTLLCTPPGFGKSTLIGNWLAKQDKPVAWFTLDQNDNDPTSFLSYLFTSLNQINPDLGRAGLKAIQSATPSSYDALMTQLLNEIVLVDQKCYLTLDDYHFIANQEIQNIVAFLVDNLPRQLHLLILTRKFPTFPIAKLRARNQLIEFNDTDLRFTHKETAEFMTRIMGLSLTGNQIAKLEHATEGWIAGLQLFALSLKDNPQDQTSVRPLPSRNSFIADYLVDEVLSRQPDSLQAFLLQTSILDRLSSELCNAVTQLADSQSVLEHLERSNLFLTPLDNKHEWYRYHHLFADMLRSRLARKRRDLIPDLYYRAFLWHKERNLPEEAIKYAIQGQLFDQAADIVEEIGERVHWQNRAQIVKRWLEALPDDLLQTRPQLSLLYGYVMLDQGKVAEAERAIKKFHLYFLENGNPSRQERLRLEGKEKAIRTSITFHRYLDGEAGFRLAKRALSILPPNQFYSRCIAAFHGASSLLLVGDLSTARDYLSEARTLSYISQSSMALLFTLSNLGHLELLSGNLHQAERHFKKVYRFAQEVKPRQGSTYSNGVVGLGLIYYEWNQLEKAARFIYEGLEIAERDDNDFNARLLLAYAAVIQLECTLGNLDQAKIILRRARQRLVDHNAPQNVQAILKMLRAEIALAEKDWHTAISWASAYELKTTGMVRFLNEPGLLIVARVYMAQNNIDPAIKYLEELLSLARQQGRGRSVIQLSTYLAAASFLRGDEIRAVKILGEVLNAAEPEGYQRIFLDVGQPIKTLLGKIMKSSLNQPKQSDYVKNLWNSIEEEDGLAPINGRPTYPLSETYLTSRELDVLKLLAAGMSYANIAGELFISENTLKYHVKNIYRKLGVKNRTQALIAAQELAIL
ncbi:MAG: LuxR C-terminal-related transcriptional regulator [Candidatus Promineifilaceae bacterium]|nr:LuxR C-terminal-related transcriptional regulator [Candidatus Promineifilaceae bacterium]